MPASAATPLRFAINLGNAVLATRDAQGKPGGLTVELANRLAQALKRNAAFVTYSTAGNVVADAGKDIWDIAFLAIDPKREALLNFTAPYITIQGTLLVRAQSHWQCVGEMDKPGVVINVGQNAAYDLWLTRELRHATLNRLASSQAAIDAFLQGVGDMAAGIRQPLEKAAQDNAGFRVLADDFTQIQQSIAVANSDSRYFAAITAQLAQWQNDGSLADIIAKHITR